jgi:integrase
LPFVSPPVAALIQLQWLTGMRPAEAVSLRMCDVDTSGEVWLYEPAMHKNRWRNHRRLIPIGPKAQQLIKTFLPGGPAGYPFSPLAAECTRNADRRRERKTPMTLSQAARQAKPRPKRSKRDHYDVDSYRRAITYGIAKAKRHGVLIPHWSPNQLRHSRGTEIRKQFGVEAAQVILGHAKADVTQVFAARDLELAIRVVKQTG